jgi:hypothetical protein
VTAKPPMSYLAAMVDFFGLLPDQNRMAFGKECQALSPENKAFFRAGLEANGYNLSA